MKRRKYPFSLMIYPIFLALQVAAFFPFWIWIIIDQAVHDKKIYRNKKLYDRQQLNKSIYARKCEVREVADKKTVRTFLQQNHMYGEFISMMYLREFDKQKIIGLYYNDSLVYLACFKRGQNDDWFCYALCSLSNCNVVGGASKCLKQVDGLVSTVSLKEAPLYEKLGFEQTGRCTLLDLFEGKYGPIGYFKYWTKA